ncbi:MAG: AmmeMemoRadiSam system protein A [Candidatus Micrarchaeia archaeon]
MEVSEADKKYLFSLARTAIKSYFSEGDRHYPAGVPEKFQKPMGVFVTLRKRGELRGCIGYPLPAASVAQAVADNAVNAAFHDPRFPSLQQPELPEVEIEITLLTVPEPVAYKDPKELLEKIKIGRDGLILEYGPYAGLLLPQVPVEEKWDVRTYLSCLCRKAGLDPEAWLTRPVRIKSFQGIVLGEKK